MMRKEMAVWIAGVVMAGAIFLTGDAAGLEKDILQKIPVILEMKTPAAAKVYGECKGLEDKTHYTHVLESLAQIEREQAACLEALRTKKSGITELFRVKRTYNGIALNASLTEMKLLEGLPGVKAVHRLRMMELSNSTSVPFIEMPELWQGPLPGLTGQGISIGIVDTGIDYLHPDFGGSGNAADHAQNDTSVLGDVPFPTAKVAGGYDFVGDAYNPLNAGTATPVPDPDPMDLLGHGTHVAGTAAGFGTNADRTTYTGGYGVETLFSLMAVGPGAAPEATLYALKIFAKTGKSFVFLPAIDWAMDPNGDGDFSDHLDILNLSIGNDLGAADAPESVACGNAADAGVIIVAAAGNRGDVFFTGQSPAAGAAVISVAASEDDDPSEWTLSADRLYSLSSRGPAGRADGRWLLKPDVCAPGARIRSACAYVVNPSAYSSVMDGSSTAAPHVAGLMAVLRQQHPAWTVSELKALAMNTAVFDVYAGADQMPPRMAPMRAGARRVSAATAGSVETIAFSMAHPEQVSVTFDTREVFTDASETQLVRVMNKGAEAAAFSVALDGLTEIPGVAVDVGAAATGEIAPGASVEVPLHLTASAAAMRHAKDGTLAEEMSGRPRHWLSEVSGYVVFTPEGSGTVLSVPYYGALRPVSEMEVAQQTFDGRAKADSAISLEGQDLNTGAGYPYDEVSLISAFELLLQSPNESDSTELEDMADLRLVGVSSDYKHRESIGQGLAESTLYFAVATWADWTTPNAIRVEIRIDTTGDGYAEYVLYNSSDASDSGTGQGIQDVFVTRLDNLHGQNSVVGDVNLLTPDHFDTVPFDTNVMILPVPVSALSLSGSNPEIQFRVETQLAMDAPYPPAQRVIDAIGPSVYHVTHPGVYFPNSDLEGPFFRDLNNTEISVGYTQSDYRDNGPLNPFSRQPSGSLGILLFHHHNASGNKISWLPVITDGDTDGDSIPDAEECSDSVASLDLDGDGVPNLADTDSDGDGISDLEEGVEDLDNDHIPNYLDLDSDADGVDDVVESTEWHTNPFYFDSDLDGIPDGVEGAGDPDGDTIINALDPDSDEDGIPDAFEGTGDPDADGTPNFLDPDSDDDGLPDINEGISDIDGDGTLNFLDTEADGDTLDDKDELTIYHTNPLNPDTDQDGRRDDMELNQGTDPRVAQSPDAPQNVQASDGAFADRVQVEWAALPGAAQYQVFRNTVNDFASAVMVTDWQPAASFADTTAQAAEEIPGSGCRGPQTVFHTFYYWVQARIAPDGAAPTEPGPVSAPDSGYRGK
ncbi:MAG TPA: S8 family serine peptidase [Candidatus Hydrogenedentes bacterium]|nr:S8 family serine peptidase [Candidatus Hydrogenedentota bacterium]